LFNTPIEIEKNAPNLLAGRTNELTELIGEILADDKLVKIVSGKTGIGKTSFLNALQFLFYTKSNFFKKINIYKRLLPCYYRVELFDQDNGEIVLQKVIKSISKSIKEHFANSDSRIPQDIKEITDYWLGLKTEDLSTEHGSEFDLQILKISHKTSLSEIYLNKSDTSYAFHTLVDLIIKSTDLEGIFLIFDNIENAETEKLIRILNEIRDEVLLRKNMYYILITSNSDLLATIHSRAKRVAGIINSVEIELQPLNRFQLVNAVEERIQVFSSRRNGHFMLPFTEDLLYKIFQFTNKDLRETFKILQYITLKGFSAYQKIEGYCKGNYQIDFTEGIDYLVDYAEKTCRKIEIDDKDKGLLSNMYISGKPILKNYKGYGFPNEKAMVKYLEQSKKEGLVEEFHDSRGTSFSFTLRFELLAVASKISPDCRNNALDILRNYE
ncbi:MAG: hypothetical protein ACKOE6_02720, partial [Flammeovirgaceae bacterium]